MVPTTLQPVSWQRMSDAVAKVRARLLHAAACLREAGVPYAVVGGNAVAAWVSRVDEAAVRNTRDVDIRLRRADLAEPLERARLRAVRGLPLRAREGGAVLRRDCARHIAPHLRHPLPA